MMQGDMEHWRDYFAKTGVDIWSVIQHAIRIAAMDDPKKFRCMRGEIAEILFAREFVETEPACTLKEGRVCQKMQAEASDLAGKGSNYAGRHHLICDDEAEALTDELEEESLVLREINTIKETCIDADQTESIIFEALRRLKYMQITVQVLKATEIGKKVNGLRKHPSLRVRTLVKDLVRQWKLLVNEWMASAKEITAAAITTTAASTDFSYQEDGLALPPLDEGALLEARASPAELSKLFSFIDEDMCGQLINREAPAASFVEPCVKDNLNHSCTSQSGSMLTDLSDVDTKASTNHPWGLRRGSTTRDLIKSHEVQTVLRTKEPGYLSATNVVLNCSGPGRPACGMDKIEFTSSKRKTASNLASARRNSLVRKNVARQVKDGRSPPAMKSDKSQADQKLESTKRKLHLGYEDADNAKKQCTVQVLDISDPRKSGQAVRARVSPHVQGKGGAQQSQIGRYS